MLESEETRDPKWFSGPSSHIAIRSIILASSIVLMALEIMQMVFFGTNYLYDVWNYIYLPTYALNFAVVYLHSSGAQYDAIVITRAASVGGFMLWFMVIYWMRLFDSTSYYVIMII